MSGERELDRIEVVRDGETIVRHVPMDDREWIVQHIELGDQWVAIVANTTATVADQSHLVVYDLLTGDVVFEESGKETDGQPSNPQISISGGYMAVAQGQETESNCVAIYDLTVPIIIDEICGEAVVSHVELDGNFFGIETDQPGCRSAWTGTLFGQDHNLVEHANRHCWSGSPVGGDSFTLWFESPPDTISGNDVLLGKNTTGEIVNLGRGDTGTAEVCWNRAYWIGGNGDLRSWDGDDTVTTIYTSEGGGISVTCNGQWVTFATVDGIYAANMFTHSAADDCSTVDVASADRTTELASTLSIWAQGQSVELPSDLTASVSGAVGSEGWSVGRGGFSDYLEGAIFVWRPHGEIQLVWSGNADSEYEIRQFILSVIPEAPPALFGCVNVDGYFG